MLAVVLAMCGTDRIDEVERDLVRNLRDTKGIIITIRLVPMQLLMINVVKRICRRAGDYLETRH
jgi:hypothetical protein